MVAADESRHFNSESQPGKHLFLRHKSLQTYAWLQKLAANSRKWFEMSDEDWLVAFKMLKPLIFFSIHE